MEDAASMSDQGETLGDILREARVRKEMSLRAFAAKVGKTPSYLSDIENDRRIPAEDLLRQMAGMLDLDFDALMARAGRVGKQAERYLRQQPAAGRLFRRISEANLDQERLQRLLEQVEELRKDRP